MTAAHMSAFLVAVERPTVSIVSAGVVAKDASEEGTEVLGSPPAAEQFEIGSSSEEHGFFPGGPCTQRAPKPKVDSPGHGETCAVSCFAACRVASRSQLNGGG